MTEFYQGDRVQVINYSSPNGYYNGEPYFAVGDYGTVVAVHGSCLEVQFDKQRVQDGRWSVYANDVVLVSSVITPAAAAAMLKDDLPLHPADKMEVAASLARIFARNNLAFDAHEFYRLADL